MPFAAQAPARDEKRQTVFAALLTYAPETASLRERALDGLVACALLDSSDEDPFRVGRIQTALLFGPDAPSFRTEVIQESLRRLIQHGKVIATESHERNAYYLTDGTKDTIRSLIVSADQLFRPVLDRLLQNLPGIPRTIGESICRTFICEVFAKFGAQIATTVTGHINGTDIVHAADLDAIILAAQEGRHLTSDESISLRERLLHFVIATTPDEVQLKFHLTQGFYFAQLVGLQDGGFNPAAERAFSGARFYLDTNVLLVALLARNGGSELFDEMVEIAGRAEVQLCVTRATINEIRRVAADRNNDLAALLDKVPDALIKRTNDQFVTAFLEARTVDAALTLDAFFNPFEQLGIDLPSRWNVEVHDYTEDDMIAASNISNVEQVIQEESLRFRKMEKRGTVLRHDIAHFSLISRERITHPKTWFLTRDRSLSSAALLLRKNNDELPFSFSLLGFLQSVSPFMRSGGNRTLPGVFASLLNDQIFPKDALFDSRELTMLAQLHADVFAMPEEQLIPALDYVKATCLKGQPYRQEDMATVALGLRSFLACSSDERRRELEAQKTQIESKYEREKEAACKARLQHIEAQQHIQQQGQGIMDFKESMRIQEESMRTQKNEIATLKQQKDMLFRSIPAFMSAIAGYLLWKQSVWLGEISGKYLPVLAKYEIYTSRLIWSLGFIVFTMPIILFLKLLRVNQAGKSAILAAVLLIEYLLSGLRNPITSIASIVTALMLISTVLLTLFTDTFDSNK